MAVSAAEQQLLAIDEVAATDADSAFLAARIDPIWEQWQYTAQIHPDLHRLYVKRALIQLMQSPARYRVNIEQQGGVSLDLSDLRKHLSALRQETQTEIVRLERRAAASRPPQAGAIAATTVSRPPFTPGAAPPSPVVDANDQRYRGDPYAPFVDATVLGEVRTR